MMLIKTIRWKNLLSTGNDFTEVNLTTPGTTLIIGENGAGKSTILDAITFALFGKTFRNINKPQLVNAITRKDLVVEIEFSIARSEYKIIRGIKPNIFEVYHNGSLVNQNAEMRDYQDYLERNILKINYKSFCQVVILGSASFVPFMQLPAAQRRGIIEDLLDLQVFTTMNTLLKDKVQENYEAIQSTINEQNIINTKIKMAREHLKELQSKSAQFIREKKTALNDIEEKVKLAKEEKEKLLNEVELKQETIGNINSLQKKIDKLKSLRIQMESKTSLLDKEIKFFTDHENCPTCKQEISSDFSCEIVNQRENEVKEVENGLIKLAEVYEQTNKELMEMLAVDRQCEELKSKISHEQLRIKMYHDQITSIKTEIDDAKKEVDSKSEDKIADLEKELVDLSVVYNELQDDKQVLSAAALLLKDGGIKTKIVNQYIPIINKLINKYLGEFDLFVEFNLDEQFNEVIRSRYRDEFSYSSFSEGEKQKIDLAILFTWRAVAKLRNSLSTNLLILDEVFDSSLDGNAADDLLKILQNISNESNVFVISHRENLHDKFENVIKFVKTKNFSRIE